MQRYYPTDLEQHLNRHYQRQGIISPADLCVEMIAASFGIDLELHNGPSFADWEDRPGGYRLIVLDKRLPEPERRAQFFHELAHPLRHCGRQDDMPELFAELQEIQAGQFQLAAALPVYLIQQVEASPDHFGKALAEEFRLPITLIMRRLEQIHARIMDRETLKRSKRFRIPPGIDVSKPHVLQALIDLRAIQKRKRGMHV